MTRFIGGRAALITALLCAASYPTDAFTPTSRHWNSRTVRTPSTTSPFSRTVATTTTTTTSSTQRNASNSNTIHPLKKGSTVALVTPFTPSGSIDIPALRSLLQFHVQSSTDGICILGTTGEASLLSMEERKMVLDVCVEEVKGIIPILCGTGTIDPKQVREMTLQAIDCGCDASLVVTPPYIKPPQRGLVRHFMDMADLGLPVVVYNVPGRTAVDISPETIGIVAEHEMIVGVKEATGDLTRVERIRMVEQEQRQMGKIHSDRSPLLLYSGDDSTEAEFVLKGGDGCISVTANVAPREMHDMMMAALDRKAEEAMRINEMLKDVHKDIFCESNPIPAKWALKRMNKIPNAYCRPPLMELDEKYHTVVEAALAKARLI
eukprot:CAMPEP_0176499576 /NCGR_PEP_ID=MMETSP0200_2-20121128/13006_1 /TAXON_ID=947934 /ORGANISM="Chaetoceros sp., Strain GSL56" /LENGTH=377 /DNA_ID=CAMNT_0017898015 /DNA_START=171 /DNA_END=1304 /DNA_ORIENTATION=+